MFFSGNATLLLLAIFFASVSLTPCSAKHLVPVKPIAKVAGPVGVAVDCPWLDSHLPVAKRVAMIMHKMTLADEINLVEGHGMHPYVGDIAENARLCLPEIGLEDGPNGVGDGMTGVTQLPSGASLAASFSRGLAYRYGRVIGAEQASKGAAVDLGPTVNIDRDPRWGREFESFSEDPELAARLGVAEIRGIQSQRTIAQVKHFAAYNQETYRTTPQDRVSVSERALQELYLPAFRAAIRRAKVGSIMCAYSTVNGYYSCENRALLTGVLRGEWNFGGFVTTDWFALHSLSGATAGTDLEEPFSRFFGVPLQHAVEQGVVSRATLNTMVAHILTPLFRFQFFNHPRLASIAVEATTAAHEAVSTQVAETGTVLLKNREHLLPLSRAQQIAVIGPAASAQVTYGGGGSAYVVPSVTISPLAGIAALAGPGRATYTQGLPSNRELTPIPAADLSPPYSGHGDSYTATLRAPQTGTYIIGFTNGCHCFGRLTFSIDGRILINEPGRPHATTYSVSVHLRRGQRYALAISAGGPMRRLPKRRTASGQSASQLLWATPSIVRSEIRKAVIAAKAAQVAVVVVADNTETEGADRPNLNLPSAQNALVTAVAAANPHTVVIVQAGAPIAMPWLGQVSAVLDTWYPGQTNGAALANVLFGKVDPSGHLPVTFPRRLADVPAASPARFPGIGGQVHYSEGLRVGYRWYDAQHIKPLFPFGFGLSYTRFRFSELHLSASRLDGVTPLHVSARVTNVGHTTGTDVVQVYLGMPRSTGEPPRKLVDFRRVTLSPGQSTVVDLTVTPREEWWWGHKGWTETPGLYRVYVGDSSALANLPLSGHYIMDTSIGDRRVSVSAPSTFKPGARVVVHVTLGTGGNEALNRVELRLRGPGGWRIEPLGETTYGTLAPHATATATFVVTPPSWTVSQYVTLFGTARLSTGSCSTDAVASHLNSPVATDSHSYTGTAQCRGTRRHGSETVLVQ